MPDEAQPALKDWFNAARYRQIADLLADAQRGFDRKRFLAVATAGLDELTLIQRVRRATVACHATLPAAFPKAVAALKNIAPQVQHGFVGIFLPDFVGSSMSSARTCDGSACGGRFTTPPRWIASNRARKTPAGPTRVTMKHATRRACQ